MASYRQLQNDTTTQLYSVASALLSPDEQTLDTALRQINLFSYDLERLQFVAQDEADLLKRIEADHKQFIVVMTQVIELTRGNRVTEARKLQLTRPPRWLITWNASPTSCEPRRGRYRGADRSEP